MIPKYSSDRVAWVDYSKGICIVAVVCLYATKYVQDASDAEGWMQYWVDFARPFRMPDFFLISGLFLNRTINRPWRDYLDKKVIHFFYFFSLWTTIYFLLNCFFGGAIADDSVSQERDWIGYASWYVEPFHMLWFIEMLPAFFVVTRLLKNIPWYICLPAIALLQILQIDTDLTQFNNFCARYVYFYAGYVFAPQVFRFADAVARNAKNSLLLLVGWAVTNELFVLHGLAGGRTFALPLGFAGAGAVIATGCLLSRVQWMSWLRYLGQNSIVVFLSFFLFTVATVNLLDGLELISNVDLRQAMVIVLSIVGPILLYRLVRGTPAALLFTRPGNVRISGAIPLPVQTSLQSLVPLENNITARPRD